MRDELNVVCRKSLQLSAALGLTLAVSTQAFALKAGHGRVDSLSGAPLRVSIPLLEVVAADVSSLRVKVASLDAWTRAGLTPPVSLESMTVSLEAGFAKDSRTLVLRSNQSVDKQIIDVLVEVSSASGTTQVQSSFLVLTRANEGVSAGRVLVKAGDTLSGIALANPIAGADLYQMLWALYQANSQAFFSQNMNLLKVGVTLALPDAQTVRATDPKTAREMYQKHLNAFKDLRGNSSVATLAPRTPTVAAPAAAAQSGSVSMGSTAPTPSGTDRVLLTSSSTAEQRDDARVAASKELAEIQSRVDSLQQNVAQLKDALSQAPSGAAGTTSGAAAVAATGSTGAAGAMGATGVSGAAGSVGVTGAAGAVGSTGAPGSSGAQGSTGAPGSSGATGSTGAAGSSGSTSPANANAAVSSSAGTASANAAAVSTPNQNTQSTLAQLWSKFSTSAVGILTAVLALGGVLVAWLLRRAGARREVDEAEGDDSPQPLNPLARTALDQKLQGIDLNLDSTSVTAKKEPSIVPSNSSPKA
jgi:pilus assembly protein FimV